MTTNRKIAKASLILITASIIGHILSIFKEMLVAKYFGLSRSIDAYYSALTIVNFVSNFLLSPFLVIFIPIFIKYRINDKDSANKTASSFANYLIIFTFAVSVIIYLFSYHILKLGFSGFDNETLILASNIMRILVLSIIFSVMVGIMSGLLNSFEHFSSPAFSQTYITISILAFMIIFFRKWHIYSIVWGYTLGLFLQSIFLIIVAKSKGYKHYFNFSVNHPAFKEIFDFSIIFFIFAIFSSTTSLINRMMASFLPAGSIAALSFADKLVQMPMLIFSGSISLAIFPFFAYQIAGKNIVELKDTLSSSIRMSGFIFIPLTVTMIIFAKPLIQILFERGSFTYQSTDLTSKILVYYSFQLLASYAMVIMMRLLYVLQDFFNLLKITIISIISMVLLNLCFMKLIDPPASGIALSTSLVVFISTALTFYYLKKKIVNMHGLQILKSLSRIALLSIISGILMFLIFNKLNAIIPYSTVNYIFVVLGSILFGFLIYLGFAFLIKLDEIMQIYRFCRTKSINIISTN